MTRDEIKSILKPILITISILVILIVITVKLLNRKYRDDAKIFRCSKLWKAMLVRDGGAYNNPEQTYVYEINGQRYEGGFNSYNRGLATSLIGDSVVIIIACSDYSESAIFDERFEPNRKENFEEWIGEEIILK